MAHPSGATVYFQGNDSQLYALDANTGALRWSAISGNQQPSPATGTYGTPPVMFHPEPWSCSPVVDHQGRVVVGTSTGRICAFNRVTGALDKEVQLRPHFQNNAVEIEAALAVGANGWIYAATRRFQHNGQNRQVLVAVDFTQWPGSMIRWTRDIPSSDGDPGSPGLISGVIADRMGYVHVTEFGHRYVVVNGTSGSIVSDWSQLSLSGKLCATPSLTEDGVAIVPMSDMFPNDGINSWGVVALRICDSGNSPPLWNWHATVSGAQTLNFVGSPAIRNDGRIIIGDSAGRLWRINAATRLLVAGWPSLQGGNARGGVGAPATTLIEELNPMVGGDAANNSAVRLDQAGRALGLAHGTPYPYSGPTGQYGAVWDFGQVKLASTAPGYGLAKRVVGGNQMGLFAGGSGTNALSLWQNGLPGVPTYLTLPAGFTGASGGPFITGIGDYGFVCGYGSDAQSAGFTRAAFWRLDVGSGSWAPQKVFFFGFGNVVVNGITATGRLFGKAQFSGSTYTGFLTDAEPSSIEDTANFGSISGASDVLESSDQGGTVGWTQYPGGTRAFRVPAGVNSPDLNLFQLTGMGGANSSAWGVNCLGYVVGRSTLPYQTQNRAVRWTPGIPTPQDLNSFLPPNSGWLLENAISISDQGVILGTGLRNGQPRLWRMRPQ